MFTYALRLLVLAIQHGILMSLGVQLAVMESGKHIDRSLFRSNRKMLQISVLPKLVFLIFESESEVEGEEKMAHYHNDYKVRQFSS